MRDAGSVCELAVVAPEVTNVVMYLFSAASAGASLPEPHVVLNLVRNRLINVADFEVFLSKMVPTSSAAVEFAAGMIRILILNEQSLTAKDIPHLLDSLAVLVRTSHHASVVEALTKMLQDVRGLAGMYSFSPTAPHCHYFFFLFFSCSLSFSFCVCFRFFFFFS